MQAAGIAVLLLFALPANAQNENGVWRQTIIVTTLDGTTMEYLIDKETKVKLEKPNLVIETENVVLNYELENMTREEVTADLLGSLDSIDQNPLPLLYQSGYLTIKDYNPDFGTSPLGNPKV